MYDVPAVITYIVNITNNTLFYIGHSMGGTTFSVMASQKPEVAKSVRAAIALCPATYEKHIKQPLIKLLAENREKIQVLIILMTKALSLLSRSAIKIDSKFM